MSFSLRFSRSSSDPRPTIRQRLHKAAVSLRERVSRRHRKGGGTDASRRALVAGSLASAVVLPFAARADGGLSPRLAELLAQFNRIEALERETSAAADRAYETFGTGAEQSAIREWEPYFDELTGVAWSILKEPTRNVVELRVKLSVWQRAVREKHESPDLTDESGWMDRAACRVLTDAQEVLRSL